MLLFRNILKTNCYCELGNFCQRLLNVEFDQNHRNANFAARTLKYLKGLSRRTAYLELLNISNQVALVYSKIHSCNFFTYF